MNAAVASRALGLPSGTIRSWISRGRIHRRPDGSIDPGCLRAHFERDTLTEAEYVQRHAELCNT